MFDVIEKRTHHLEESTLLTSKGAHKARVAILPRIHGYSGSNTRSNRTQAGIIDEDASIFLRDGILIWIVLGDSAKCGIWSRRNWCVIGAGEKVTLVAA